MILLKNWMIRYGLSKETMVLIGDVYGDKRFADGTTITTSKIVSLEGNIAISKSGTVYTLGQRTNIPKEDNKDKGKYYLLKKGGSAIHKTGDISRDAYDAELIQIFKEDENYLIGNFVEGFGFVAVKFLKSDCRLATEKELKMCDDGQMEKIKF